MLIVVSSLFGRKTNEISLLNSFVFVFAFLTGTLWRRFSVATGRNDFKVKPSKYLNLLEHIVEQDIYQYHSFDIEFVCNLF